MVQNLSLTDTGLKHIGEVLGLYINKIGATDIISELHTRYSNLIGSAYTTGEPLKSTVHVYEINSVEEYNALKNIFEWHIKLFNSIRTQEIYISME